MNALSNTLTQANQQWMKRPDDERFESLPALANFTQDVRNRSAGKVISSRGLQFVPDGVKGLHVVTGEHSGPNDLTHWSFGQAATLAGAPAGYLRTLPAPIAADALNWGMRFNRDVEDIGLLTTFNKSPGQGPATLRAATGPRYGRIWNADICSALVDKFGDGVSGDWTVPGEFGNAVDVTKANTTLFASDRDMFVFLADEKNRVDVHGRRDGKPGSMARGFFLWNSEVGSQSIGAAFFLFDYVCKNRIVWGAQQFKEIRLRHTVSAPDRWLEEIQPVLLEYSDASAKDVESTIAAAQARKVDDMAEFLNNRFGKKNAALYSAAHERDESRPMETLWDIATGMTAHARSIKWQDERVALEREAGKILDMAIA
jgi:hypothetical protein